MLIGSPGAILNPLRRSSFSPSVFYLHPKTPFSQTSQRTEFIFTALRLSPYPSWYITQVRSNSATLYQIPSVALTVETRTLGTTTGLMIWGWIPIFGTPDLYSASYIPQDAVTPKVLYLYLFYGHVVGTNSSTEACPQCRILLINAHNIRFHLHQ